MRSNILTPVLLLIATMSVVGLPEQKSRHEQIPAVIKSPSAIGEVSFPHRYHIDELEIECSTCHHETNAVRLHFPHEDYFDDFWIDCTICHRQTADTQLMPQACSKCHHASPTNIADETLSSKVVIHKNCWSCHEAEKGEEASRSCSFCHVGAKTKLK